MREGWARKTGQENNDWEFSGFESCTFTDPGSSKNRIMKKAQTKAHHNQTVETSNKQETIKASIESRYITYRGIKKKMTAGFLSEIQSKATSLKYWKKMQVKIIYPGQIYFKNKDF